ncbi:MAG TPA: tRNA epoxyqueuosine(34) reductase QueG [Paludibacter sp.]|nr:tRNA epoxyqueuosine(34) reductase QueG [Paludibacter sp.]
MIREAALSLGFDACGIAKAVELTEDAVFLQSWLSDGMYGEMGYLARNFEKRTDPRILVPGCKSIVVVLMNYYPLEKQLNSAPKIAKYAYSQTDYHTVLKGKLNELEKHICEVYGSESVCSDYQHMFVDSAPVLERRWAERAGLGWIGKHKQLIHPNLGSYCFIGILMLNIEVDYDSTIHPRCGSCTRCIDACPTKALANGKLDARRCISYLTIENKNDIPTEFHNKLSNCALGCDICADACPWNHKWAKPHSHSELKPVEELFSWDRETWESLSKQSFDQTFRYSSVKRAGYYKLKQNIATIVKKHL